MEMVQTVATVRERERERATFLKKANFISFFKHIQKADYKQINIT